MFVTYLVTLVSHIPVATLIPSCCQDIVYRYYSKNYCNYVKHIYDDFCGVGVGGKPIKVALYPVWEETFLRFQHRAKYKTSYSKYRGVDEKKNDNY